ncbi:MAG: hypothetical protein VB140_03215 [Burkholderia sp.]
MRVNVNGSRSIYATTPSPLFIGAKGRPPEKSHRTMAQFQLAIAYRERGDRLYPPRAYTFRKPGFPS